jgi:small subunit ribosomal protein S18
MRRKEERKRTEKKFRERDDDRFMLGPRRRTARFEITAETKLDYKNLALLEKFLTDTGKVMSRRITGVNGKQSRQIMISIKRARFLGLLPSGGSKR